jgi:hypothetical protein
MLLDPIVVARIVTLMQDGREQRETARIVGKSLCAQQNVYQGFEVTGLITRRPGSGRKRVTIPRDNRFFSDCKFAEWNRFCDFAAKSTPRS